MWSRSSHFAGAALALVLLTLTQGCPAPVRVGRLTVIVSGNTQGYLRNCGCSAGQAGGELRKARMVKQEREEARIPEPSDKNLPAEVIAIDMGNFSNPQNRVSRAESAGVVRSMMKLEYDAVGLGMQELMYSQQDLQVLIGQAGLPLTAANLRFVKPRLAQDHSAGLNALLKPYIVVKTPSRFRVGIIHVIDLSVGKRLGEQNGFELSDPKDAAEAILKAHKREAGCWILSLANARGEPEDRERMQSLEGLALLIGFRRRGALQEQETGAGFPRLVPAPFERAKDILRVSVYFDSKGAPTSALPEEVAIPDTVMPDEYVQQIIDQLQPELEKMTNEDAEIVDQPNVHPRYVGYSVCGACHEAIVAQLSQSKHALAYQTLVGKNEHKSAACLPCHVVGYNKAGGWNILSNSIRPEMRGVQCESCHGPGEYHVALASGGTKPPDLEKDGRGPTGIVRPTRETCLKCHDEPNSPHFSFDTYWQEIKHKR